MKPLSIGSADLARLGGEVSGRDKLAWLEAQGLEREAMGWILHTAELGYGQLLSRGYSHDEAVDSIAAWAFELGWETHAQLRSGT